MADQQTFLERLDQFRAEKVPRLGSSQISSSTREQRPPLGVKDTQQALQHVMTLPLEVFLDVPAPVRKRRFLEDVRVGTVVLAKVIHNRQEAGLFLCVIETATAQRRFIKDIELQAVCPVSEFEIMSDRDLSDYIDEFRAGDVVRAVVFAIDIEQEQLSVSFRRYRLPRQNRGLELGLVNDEDAEVILKRIESEVDVSCGFSHYLKRTAGFSNPHCVDNLLHDLGVSSQLSSFMSGIQGIHCKPNDYGDELRKKQSHDWAMETVSTGVDYLKSGNMEKAEKHFDHALQIEPSNVEAYVARGALCANENRYESAMKDFQEALKLNPRHKNARKYLSETQTAQGNSRFNKGDLEGAMECYRAALEVNPDLESARDQLQTVQNKLELQALRAAAAKAKEKEESKRATSLYKLRQLITDEETSKTGSKSDRKDKKKKAKTKKTKKSKHKKSRITGKRRLSSRSGQSDDSSQTDDNSQTPSPPRKRSRERSWTYSDDSPTSPKRVGGQCRLSSEKSPIPYPSRQRFGSPARLNSPSESQTVRQHRQTRPIANATRRPLERTRGMLSSPRKEQNPGFNLPPRRSAGSQGLPRPVSLSESGSASPSSRRRSQGSDGKYRRRLSRSRYSPLSPDSQGKKRPFGRSRSSSSSPRRKPRGQQHQYGERGALYRPSRSRSRQSDSSSPERQRFRSKLQRPN